MNCSGCKYSLLDFGALTADDSRLWCFLLEHHVVSDFWFLDIKASKYRLYLLALATSACLKFNILGFDYQQKHAAILGSMVSFFLLSEKNHCAQLI